MKDINRTYFIPGGEAKDRKGDTVKGLEDALKIGADCGCGIDCCNKELVLEDKTTGNVNKLYFDNGVLYVSINGTVSTVDLTAV